MMTNTGNKKNNVRDMGKCPFINRQILKLMVLFALVFLPQVGLCQNHDPTGLPLFFRYTPPVGSNNPDVGHISEVHWYAAEDNENLSIVVVRKGLYGNVPSTSKSWDSGDWNSFECGDLLHTKRIYHVSLTHIGDGWYRGSVTNDNAETTLTTGGSPSLRGPTTLSVKLRRYHYDGGWKVDRKSGSDPNHFNSSVLGIEITWEKPNMYALGYQNSYCWESPKYFQWLSYRDTKYVN